MNISENQIKQKSISEKQQKNQTKSIFGCNCKKSKCLKLYCECFAAQQQCSPSCNCTECNNNEDYIQIKQSAIKSLLQKNPEAFQQKIIKTTESEEKNQDMHIKGCTCKKSKCKKKYCECFGAGIKCAKTCKCEHCKNGKPDEDFQKEEEIQKNLKQKSKQKKIKINDNQKSNDMCQSQKNDQQNALFQIGGRDKMKYLLEKNFQYQEISDQLK